MDPVTLTAIVAILLLILLVFLHFRTRSELVRSQEREASLLREHAHAYQILQGENSTLKAENARLQTALTDERQLLIRHEESVYHHKEKIAGMEQTLEKFNKDFELIASRILDEKTQKFTETNRGNLDQILAPLKENLKAFEEKVDKVYSTENAARHILQGEIGKLIELNRQISEEAHNLSHALRRDSKKQGNWGEIVLDRLLEASGLQEGINYTRQAAFTDDEGNRMYPDVLIHLPQEKNIVVDAKVSLRAFEQMVNAETDESRSHFLKEHIAAVRQHINGLGAKNYADLYGIGSPDFVLLFLPIESSFAVAVENDNALFEFAWNKRVVVVTPSTLLATLKTVASIWKIEKQNRYAFEIAREAGLLYDKFCGFLDDLDKVGKQLGSAQKTHDEAVRKLRYGPGNIIAKTEKLKQLGAKTSKQIDRNLLDDDAS
ncbi:MAG: DNA recombination protein RmuC [Mucilaginibacter polytrichastri]|nr:DNA recombination protein RmuC [Mucilaginibacter polytrichastri]